MLRASYVSPANANETLTRGNFYQLLQGRPQYIGLVGKMHPEYTMMYLTQCLQNVVYNDKVKKPSGVTQLDTMSFSWAIEDNEIKRITFAEDVDQNATFTGSDEIVFYFTESYYQNFDIFEIDGSRQQCRVIAKPEIISANCVKVTCRLIDPTYKLKLDNSACMKGMTTRWLYSAHPEIHYEGYSKYTSNIERYKGYITRHRYEINVSSEYAMKEDYFLKLSKEEGAYKQEAMYSMSDKQQILLNTTLAGMNASNLLAKTNMDANGHCTDIDQATGQEIIIGDGLIPQIERYASKFVYNEHITWTALQRMIHALNEKRQSYIGNKYLFLCNDIMWHDIQSMGMKTAYAWKEVASTMWSKAADGFVKLGATFSTFEIEGNEVTFKVDNALCIEYPNKGFAMMLNVTPDELKGRPAVECFSLMNKEFQTNFLPGVGGENGMSAGAVSSPLAATTYINWGYTGIGVYMPFLSAMLIQA